LADGTFSDTSADRFPVLVLPSGAFIGQPPQGGVAHERLPLATQLGRQPWGEVYPGVDEEGGVEVVEELLLVAVGEQPREGLDATLAVHQVGRAEASVGTADIDRGEACRRVDAPELVGHEVGASSLAVDLVEGHAGLEAEVEAEGVEDALGHRKGRGLRAPLVRGQRGLGSPGPASDCLLSQPAGDAGDLEKRAAIHNQKISKRI